MYKQGQTVKRNDTGEQVQIVDVLPVGTAVFYRVEYESGDTTLLQATALRPVQSIAERRVADRRAA